MLALYITLSTFIAMALRPAVAIESCPSAGTPGLPGIPGIPGRDGRDGAKGEKGERGLPMASGRVPQKGQKGEPGQPGPAGKIGQSGVKGEQGLPGVMGPVGDKGTTGLNKPELQSAFSVTRQTKAHPTPKSPVRFPTVITNLNNHYDVESGKFVCHIPGTYYFVYHASSDASLCINLVRDDSILASFCDHLISNSNQVSSGGLMVYLQKDQQVWLETNDYKGMIGMGNKRSVFSGFLLYPH